MVVRTANEICCWLNIRSWRNVWIHPWIEPFFLIRTIIYNHTLVRLNREGSSEIVHLFWLSWVVPTLPVRNMSVLESYGLTHLNVRTVITTHRPAQQNAVLGRGILYKPVLTSVILWFRPSVNISRFLLNILCRFCPIYIKFAPHISHLLWKKVLKSLKSFLFS